MGWINMQMFSIICDIKGFIKGIIIQSDKNVKIKIRVGVFNDLFELKQFKTIDMDQDIYLNLKIIFSEERN